MGALWKFGDFTVLKNFRNLIRSSSSYSGSWRSYNRGRNNWGALPGTVAAREAAPAAETAGELLQL
jgi:hypothetical protein